MNGKELWAIVRATYHEYGRADVGFMSAALTYYTFFSLFPLVLLGLIVAGAVVDPQAAREFIFSTIAQIAPGAADWLETLLADVLEQRDSVGWFAIVGVLTLAFSASGAFDALDKSINRAWGTEKMPNFLISKLSSFIMMGAIGVLLIVSVSVSAILRTLQSLTVEYFGTFTGDTFIWDFTNIAASFAVTLLAFTLLFRFVPRCPVRMADIWLAALITAIIWTIAKEVFAIFLGSSFANFSATYGTLGTVIALLLWIYVSSVIILTGAEFSAETAKVRELRARAGKALAQSSRKPSPWLADGRETVGDE
jgi:membrane protein